MAMLSPAVLCPWNSAVSNGASVAHGAGAASEKARINLAESPHPARLTSRHHLLQEDFPDFQTRCPSPYLPSPLEMVSLKCEAQMSDGRTWELGTQAWVWD